MTSVSVFIMYSCLGYDVISISRTFDKLWYKDSDLTSHEGQSYSSFDYAGRLISFH